MVNPREYFSRGGPRQAKRRFPYGVTRREGRSKPWMVKFKWSKQSIYVGSYATYEEACEAAKNWIDKA